MRYRAVEISTDHDGAVRQIRLPGGPLTAEVAHELVAAATELWEDRVVRLVLLTSAAPAFCTGASPDLDPLSFPVDPAAAIARIRQPVLVAVEGRCESVGFEVALAADVRVASAAAQFRLGDATAGRLPCWGGTQRLPRAVGQARATAMVLLGQALDARAGFDAGLLYRVADPLADAVTETVSQLLGTAPLALELAKEAVHRGSELPLRDGLRLEGDLNHLLQMTDDRAEGLAAFFAKRPPDFAGR